MLNEPVEPTAVGSSCFFTVGGELWRSDGTGPGTVRLATFSFPYPANLTAAGSRLFFTATGTLWRSDGTAASTVPAGGADPIGLTARQARRWWG